MGAGYHLNQDNPLLHEIDLGDSLWAFTRTKSSGYSLAAELIVRAETLNLLDFRYGRYRLWVTCVNPGISELRDSRTLYRSFVAYPLGSTPLSPGNPSKAARQSDQSRDRTINC